MMEYHLPVLLKESVDGLNIKPNGIYVDVTFGGGGHSREILKRLEGGKLVGFDQDEEAMANVPNDERFVFVRHNFRFLKNFLKYHGIEQIDGLLADLGVSSHHFDSPHRGFSFRFDAQLDMRMNRHSEITAAHLVNCYTADELTRIFRVYGELKNAAKVAHLLVEHRTKASLQTVGDLQEALRKVTPRWGDHQFYAQVFQALRIEVNHEIDYLRSMLTQATEILAPGGRLSIISYHSLEDRVVKNFFRTGSFDTGSTETDLFGNILRPLTPVNNKVIVPDQKELELNNRARSARLRIAEKQEHGEYDRAG